MERKDSVGVVGVGKVASWTRPSGWARATELLVVPKSMPIAGPIG